MLALPPPPLHNNAKALSSAPHCRRHRSEPLSSAPRRRRCTSEQGNGQQCQGIVVHPAANLLLHQQQGTTNNAKALLLAQPLTCRCFSKLAPLSAPLPTCRHTSYRAPPSALSQTRCCTRMRGTVNNAEAPSSTPLLICSCTNKQAPLLALMPTCHCASKQAVCSLSRKEQAPMSALPLTPRCVSKKAPLMAPLSTGHRASKQETSSAQSPTCCCARERAPNHPATNSLLRQQASPPSTPLPMPLSHQRASTVYYPAAKLLSR